MGLLEIFITRHILELPPWLVARMPVGADVAPSVPTVIGAILLRAEVMLRVDGALASPGKYEGGWGEDERGIGRRLAACSQASQSGLGSRPAKGLESMERLRRAGSGLGGIAPGVARSYGHTTCSTMHSQW
jgi:hypothetical protein